MAYTEENFKTKKSMKEALAAGKPIRCFNPGIGTAPREGTIFLEGPHYPAPHTWYAQGTMRDGLLVKVK